ncbi:ricin B lectin domain-containing protein [Mycena latifolia]|nr:ricin B lectin domain-containing protein [Mycena latifolia]
MSKKGTSIHAWEKRSFSDILSFNQLWLVKKTTSGHYTIQNLRGGTYMDLKGGDNANGTQICGCDPGGPAGEPSTNQQWKIILAGGFYRIRNAEAQTYVNLYRGGTKNGTNIVGWEHTTARSDELWKFERRSVATEDIISALRGNGRRLDDIHSFRKDDIYFVVPLALLSEIYYTIGLGSMQTRRFEMFEDDTYALTYKTGVAIWCEENIKVDFSLLFGFIGGIDSGSGFNWTLSDDLSKIVSSIPGMEVS